MDRSVNTTDQPVFIGGTQRSGTSLVRALVASNTYIYFPFAEMKFFTRIYSQLFKYEPWDQQENLEDFLRDYGKPYKVLHRQRSKGRFRFEANDPPTSGVAVFQSVMRELAGSENRQRWGEKTPGNECVLTVFYGTFPGPRS